jgi:hypothetical protein
MSKSIIETEICKHDWRSFKCNRAAVGMTLWCLTNPGLISTLIINEYDMLLEKHRPIEIQSSTFMLTIVWGVTGFHVFKRLPKEVSLMRVTVLMESCPRLPLGMNWNKKRGLRNEESGTRNEERRTSNRILIIHADNVHLHTARNTLRYINSCEIIKPHNPPYSPDLPPSNFSYSAISTAGSNDNIMRVEGTLWPR